MEIQKIRKDFPILLRKINGKKLAYLDNAATSQKPRQVLAAMEKYYLLHNANVHRGIHTLSVEATDLMENARRKVAKFVGVDDPAEIIFTRNATEAINLVAYSWGRLNINRGDEIVLTVAEHHSNFVTWQQLAAENGAVLKIVPVDDNGGLDLAAFGKSLTKKTKLVTFFHVSNVLGTINDVRKLVEIINKRYVALRFRSGQSRPLVLIDGAQAVPHMPVDIPKMGCDFYVFTGHKMLGPTGIGVLWGRRELLEQMPPFLFGGEMISKVGFDKQSLRSSSQGKLVTAGLKSSWNELPWKFEAGTPDIAGAIGLGAAVDYLNAVGVENIRKHEVELTGYAISRLSGIQDIRLLGPKDPKKRGGVISFNVGSIHAHDVASILDSEGIAIRSGHHCAQPLMEFLGISSAARASFYIYNTKEEVDRLVEGIGKVKKVFKLTKNVIARSEILR